MRALIFPVLLALPARAEPVPAAAMPQVCVDVCPAPPRPKPSVETIVGLEFGVLTAAVGTAVVGAHFAQSDHANRMLDFVPVVGPVIVASQGRESPGWTVALVFAAWAQAASILTFTIATEHLLGEQVKVGASVAPGGGSLNLMTPF
jgi:hypothetical protein